MSVRLIFDAGSLAGRSWDVPEGGSLEIGRSRSCSVRPAEPDVSGRHAVVRDASGSPVLEVVSAHRTVLDGEPLPSGTERALAEGSRVTLGQSLRFRVHFVPEDGGRTAAPSVSSGGSVSAAAEPPAPPPENGGETLLVPSAASAGEGPSTAGSATVAPGTVSNEDEAGADETQLLETQAVSREEIELLRGAYVRHQRRRIAIRTVAVLFALAAVFGVYKWLSAVDVPLYLSAPKISFDGVIRGEEGRVGIVVPYRDGGRATASGAEFVRWNTALGRNWEVPYSVFLTNWTDPRALREDRETTFQRWREANGGALRWDGEYTAPPLFLGGGDGAFPGVRCLQRKYYRSGDAGEIFVGTATFFRCGDRCHVLQRELPAEEEGRGWIWISPVWSTLYAGERNDDGSENPFAACHWEGCPDEDEVVDAPSVVDDCKKLLSRGDKGSWSDVERRLSLVLRSVCGRDDGDSRAVRTAALNQLRRLREAQREFWNLQRLSAVRAAASPAAGAKELKSIQKNTADWFPSEDDERHWIVHRERWWKQVPERR